ncbi:MAG: hypothetical protein QTN59_12130 [Candidatus Electrothrix communis]|nr:MAG: hypothetical protein QTN59_12130 [Candidatus Electrothrix communis]
MEILRSSSTELILGEGNILAGILFTVFIGGPFFFLLYYVDVKELGEINFSCDRIEETEMADCRVTKIPLFHLGPTMTENYDSVLSASYKNDNEVEESDFSTRHYVVLTTGYEKKTIVLYIHKGRVSKQAQNLVKKTNQFLRSKRQSNLIDEPIGFYTYLRLAFYFCLLLIAVMLPNAASAKTILSLDKRRNKISRRTITIIGFWTETSELQELKTVEVEEDRSGDCGVYFALVMTMRSGKKYKFRWVSDPQRAFDNANQIRRFLDLSPLPLPAVFST